MLLSDGTNVMVERVDTFEIGGETLALEVAAVAEVDGDGKIKRWRDYYDLQSVGKPDS